MLIDGETGETRAVKTTPIDQRGYSVALGKAIRGGAPNPVPPEQGAAWSAGSAAPAAG